MVEVNVPLLRKAVEWVEEQAGRGAESEWNQETWFEPASLNAQRKAAEILGVAMRPSEIESDAVCELAEALESACGSTYCVAGWIGQTHNSEYVNHTLVDGVHVSKYAAGLLGISRDESARLFDSCNTAEDVRSVAEDIAGERL